GYGDQVAFIGHARNNGVSRLRDVVIVLGVPDGASFAQQFVDVAADADVYYTTSGQRGDPAPPVLARPGAGDAAAWTATRPDVAAITHVAFVVPALSSPFVSGGDAPISVDAEITVTVDLPGAACPERRLTARGHFEINGYTTTSGQD